jgi:hypothetical protein
LYYDSTLQRWISKGGYGTSSVFCIVENQTPQSIPDNARTDVDTGAATFDAFSMYDATNHKIVIPFDGFYRISFYGEWEAHATAGNPRELYLDDGGGQVALNTIPSMDRLLGQQVDYVDYCAPGREFFAHCYQSSGGALNFGACRISVFKVN